jgi:hypothetical protein
LRRDAPNAGISVIAANDWWKYWSGQAVVHLKYIRAGLCTGHAQNRVQCVKVSP